MSHIPARSQLAAPPAALPYPHAITVEGRPVDGTIGRPVAPGASKGENGRRPLPLVLMLLLGALPALLLLFGLKKK